MSAAVCGRVGFFARRGWKAALAEEQQRLREQWYERNRIMAGKIVARARQYPGGRLVVMSGAEHRYILLDLLKKEKGVVLKEYWEE